MEALQAWFVDVVPWLPIRELARSLSGAGAFFGASLGAMLAFEWRAGRALDVYRSRNFVTDLIYFFLRCRPW